MLLLRDKNSIEGEKHHRKTMETLKERNCEKQKRKRGYDDDARRKGELERRAQVVHTWCTVAQEVRFLFIHTGSGKEFSTR